MGNIKMKFVNSKLFAVIFIAIISMSLAKRARRSRMDLTKPSKDLNSCTRLGLTDTTFKAECVANNLAVIKTEVDLSKCISNNNGVLTFSGAAYQKSCNSCLMANEQTSLHCERCYTIGNASTKKTTITLTNHLKVVDGKITNCGTAKNLTVKQPPPPTPPQPKRIRNDKMERDPFKRRRRF